VFFSPCIWYCTSCVNLRIKLSKPSYQKPRIILAIIKINDKTKEAGSQRDGASSDTIYNPVSGDFIISLSQ
ncbi:hypothetical protein, partial [uncultured Psychrobacter sp.]|uniref:hypothetical protein n=1 Tax=uncultured Psychrobacter sp. TaxID=259303 RepID=UPI0030DC90ED